MNLNNIPLILCHPSNHGGNRAAEDIKYLVYHYTGNDGDTAKNNCLYYQNTVVQASAHYFVDDDGAIQSVPDLTAAWAVGGKKWSDCNKTGGGTLFGKVTNRNSISIEMCDTQHNGVRMASEKTLANAAELGRMLMEKYRIPIDRVIRHFDVTGKHCPAYFMDNAAWNTFKARLAPEKESEPMEEKRYQTLDEIKARTPWAYPTIKKLADKGYIKGDYAGFDLTVDMMRLLVINDRAGCYGKE